MVQNTDVIWQNLKSWFKARIYQFDAFGLSNFRFLRILFFPSEQVKSEYAQLKERLGVVTQERDLALWEKNQLQGKLENLEQVLKVGKHHPSDAIICQLSTSGSSSRSIQGSNSVPFKEPNSLLAPSRLPVPPTFPLPPYAAVPP